MKNLITVLSVVVSLGACGRSRSDPQSADVDQLFAEWNRTDAPGCAVGVSRNGTVVYTHGYGMANLELGVPITPDTVFALASITKSFTAMSALLAAEQGKLSLDDEVQKYIPEWTDRDDHITIRHLLTHTSGLRDAFGLLGWASPSESAGDQNEAILRMLARQRGVNFPPGTEYQYNNGGYNLLASVVKRATGQSLRVFADANIFTPLGMTHSYIQDDPTMLIPNRAPGYSNLLDGWHLATMDTDGVVGNAGMRSTVGDLLLWEQNFDNPHVGTAATLAAMQTPTVLPGGQSTSYGMGLGMETYRGVPMIGHSGGGNGSATKVVRFPVQHVAVAVLCNEDSVVMGGRARVNPDMFVNGVADIYLADALGPHPARAVPAPPPTSVKLSDDELSPKAGLYRLVGRDLPILVTMNHSRLMVRSYYQDDVDFELTSIAANRFLFQNRVPLEFVPATAGRDKEWHVGEGKDYGLWQVVTFRVPPSGLRAYAGEYRSDELDVTYRLEPLDSALVVKSTGRPEVTIVPFSKDVFVGDWVGIVTFSRDSRRAVSGFTVNRENARGLRFDRMKRTD